MPDTIVTTCANCGTFDIHTAGRPMGPCRLCGSVRIWRRTIKDVGKGPRRLETHDRLLDVVTGEVLSEDPEASPYAVRTFGRVLERMVRMGAYADVAMEGE